MLKHISLEMKMQVTKKCRHTGSVSHSKVVNPWYAWRTGVFTWINVVTITGVSTRHSDYESTAPGARAGSGDCYATDGFAFSVTSVAYVSF